MKEIETKRVKIEKPIEIVYNTLSDFTNFHYIPNDKVKDFKATKDTCSFSVNNMAEIELKIESCTPYSSIIISSSKEIVGGISFSLNLLLDKEDEGCLLNAKCMIKCNPMMFMMFKKQVEDGLNRLMDTIKLSLEKS
ncbi:MAG: hypothetical protein LKE30_01690 [Bacteroidales bacterium]|jgi:hypothetical protein|nr:hypothetical protein [Bacteroidales bacterium]